MITQLTSSGSPMSPSYYKTSATSGALSVPTTNSPGNTTAGDVIVNPVYLPAGSQTSTGQTTGTGNRPITNVPNTQQPQQQPVYQPPKPKEPGFLDKLLRALPVIVSALAPFLPFQQQNGLYNAQYKISTVTNAFAQLKSIFNPTASPNGGSNYAQAQEAQALATSDSAVTPVTKEEAIAAIKREYGAGADAVFRLPQAASLLANWPTDPARQRKFQERLIDYVAARLEGQPQPVAMANNEASTTSAGSTSAEASTDKPRKTRADILLEQQTALASIGGTSTFSGKGPSFSS